MNPSSTTRPQLSLDELHQLKWMLGGVLSLLALWTVLYMDIDAWALMLVASAATVAATLRPTLPARVPPWAHLLAFPAIVLFFVGDLWLTAQVLPAMVRLDILLLIYRNITYRQRRDDLQVIVLGLFLIVVAGVLTVSLAFAAQILLFTAVALGFLLTVTLTDAATGGQKPAWAKGEAPAWAAHVEWRRLMLRWRQVADWRVVALGAGLFTGVVVLSGVLFLLIPRFQLDNSLFLDRLISKKSKTGFSETVRFGDVSDIQQDTAVALSVDVTDRTRVPASPYWRMLVLEDYADGTFRLSPAMQRAASLTPDRERTNIGALGRAKPQLGPAVAWTFFLESGVSRYLPLLGDFERLQFVEPQTFRYSSELGLIALRDEPLTMTAYRVEGFDTSGVMPDPIFARRWRERDPAAAPRNSLQIRLSLSAEDQAVLERTRSEIAGAGPLTAEEFARRASAWLIAHHSYSLSPVIPEGKGDKLIRWMASREAGHCELFAGSLVLLARAQGLPARVVTGFRGGTWNTYSNNFTVRNSDAHAWAEIFDELAGAWRRADALGVAGATQDEQAAGEASIARRADSSWTARWESLRVFWYRRIVSFDRQSQLETLRSVKQAAQNSGRWLREKLAALKDRLRRDLTQPWELRRIAAVIGVVGLLAGAVSVWRQWGSLAWAWRFRRGTNAADPVRREASRWLTKFAGVKAAAEAEAVRDELQRLRFGAPGTWTEPYKVFRRARHAWRAAKKGAARHSDVAGLKS